MTRILIVLALLAGIADARPGGGHSSSGGGRSSSSSSGRSYSGGSSYRGGSYSGGGSAIGGEALIGLFILFGVVWFIAAMVNSNKGNEWTSSGLANLPPPAPAPDLDLAPVLARDPTFSLALFEDFVFQLYAVAQRRRGQLESLQPYLAPDVARELAQRGPPPAQVLVGVLRVQRAVVRPSDVHLTVYIESTLLAGTPIASTERWSFVRAATAQTKPPERTRTWPCPSCGAPWQPSPTRTCAHCGAAVRTGQFDWCVETVWVDAETVANASLTGTVEEYGNDLPTVVDAQAKPLLDAITADDPEVTFETLYPRIQLIYNQLNAAWNANDLKPVRGLVTGSLQAYLAYWLSAYARQGLRNALTGAELETAKLAKVTRDAFYDAITVRIIAHGFDATYDGKGRVVGGSPTRVRPYTEYWTFIRASARRGKITTTPSCPNCGAPLQISDVGDCEHCGVAVENGGFDWTLSKIEQDDNYGG